MSAISITRLYDLLLGKLGKETAQNLTSYIEEKVKDEVDNKSLVLASKGDIADTKKEISDTKKEIAGVKTDLADAIARLRFEMAANKAELIKWMFVFWTGQVAVTFGLILFYLKK